MSRYPMRVTPLLSSAAELWTHPMDSSRLLLTIKQSQVQIYLGLIHSQAPLRNKLDCIAE